MRFEDFVLLQLLWHFASLRLSKQNKNLDSNELEIDEASSARGDAQVARELPAKRHAFRYRQAD